HVAGVLDSVLEHEIDGPLTELCGGRAIAKWGAAGEVLDDLDTARHLLALLGLREGINPAMGVAMVGDLVPIGDDGARRIRVALDHQSRDEKGAAEIIAPQQCQDAGQDRKSTRLNSSHSQISYAVFCLKKK